MVTGIVLRKAAPLLTLALSPSLLAQGFPSLESDLNAAHFNKMVRSGILSWEDLAELALWASDATNLAPFLEYIAQVSQELEASLPEDPRLQGDYILSFIHARLLRRYGLQQTRLDRLLNYGAALLASGREEDAIAWVLAAREWYPGDGRYEELIFAAGNNLLAGFIRQDRYADAKAALERHRAAFGLERALRFEAQIVDSEILSRLE